KPTLKSSASARPAATGRGSALERGDTHDKRGSDKYDEHQTDKHKSTTSAATVAAMKQADKPTSNKAMIKFVEAQLKEAIERRTKPSEVFDLIHHRLYACKAASERPCAFYHRVADYILTSIVARKGDKKRRKFQTAIKTVASKLETLA